MNIKLLQRLMQIQMFEIDEVVRSRFLDEFDW